MMDKKYTFTDESWWNEPGCDCCEGYWMEAYNLASYSGDYKVFESWGGGSVYSIEECYALAIQLETGLSDEAFDDLSMEDIFALAEDNNIIVEIIQ